MAVDFCSDALTFFPIDTIVSNLPPNNIGIIMAVSGLLNMFMSLLTVVWIKRNELEAQAEGGREEAAKSVIFPVFVIVLWVNVFANIYAGFVVAWVPLSVTGANSYLYSLLYASQTAMHHVVVEGIAFLLMQKGCGYHAGWAASKISAVYGLLTFLLMVYIYRSNSQLRDIVELIWDFCMLVFYFILWYAPQERLFRRPALISYSKFWVVYRLAALLINILFFSPTTVEAGACSYIIVQIIIFSVFQPLVCYWALLQDSRWWQGLDIVEYTPGSRTPSYENIRSPLIGSDFSLSTAQSLAATVDSIRVHGRVKMLNFAHIKVDFRKPLGSGSFSKVYKGAYRGKECAIKMIYTVDLTTDVIRRVAAEASILSSIRHPNIVHIYGVSVLPPSVCLILEVCSFGSLSDIIRGYGFDWSTSSRAPLSLAYADILYLALGCARGLAAVHAYDRYLCHRDVKSFNFLVDHQFTVKIADLELGVRDKERADRRRRRSRSRSRGGRQSTPRDRAGSGWRSILSSLSSSTAQSGRGNSRSSRAPHSNSSSKAPSRSYSRHQYEDEEVGGISQPSYEGANLLHYADNNNDDDDLSVQSSLSGYSHDSGNNKSNTHNVGDDNEVATDELLANWMAPEVMRDKRFQQASDVYALGTVMWEILAKQLPFENETQREIRQKVLEGYQHPIPLEVQNTPLAYIIEQCWSMEPSHRPKAQEVVRFLEKILKEDVYASLLPAMNVEYQPDFTTMLHYYEACYRKATVSDVQSQLRLSVPNDVGGSGGSSWWGTITSLFSWPFSSSNQHANTSKSSRRKGANNFNSLLLLNPLANHHDEADDEDFAFSLPTYSVRGSELGQNNNTALSVASDLRRSMQNKQQTLSEKQRQKQIERQKRRQLQQLRGGGQSVIVEDVNEDDEDKDDDIDLVDESEDIVFDEREMSHSQSYNGSRQASSNNSSRQSSSDGYHISSLARVAMPMPPAAVEAVRMVRRESYWKSLEASQEAWAIITPQAPYLIVHATKAWFATFSTVCATHFQHNAADAPMLSLLALLAPELEAMPSQTTAANTYVQLAASSTSGSSSGANASSGMSSAFRKMRSASAKEVLKGLQRKEEYHGVLCLHLPHLQALARGQTDSSGAAGGDNSGESNRSGAGLLSLTSSSRSYSSHLGNSSVSVDASGRLKGTNTMFSVHVYPVYYQKDTVWMSANNDQQQPSTPGRGSTVQNDEVSRNSSRGSFAQQLAKSAPIDIHSANRSNSPTRSSFAPIQQNTTNQSHQSQVPGSLTSLMSPEQKNATNNSDNSTPTGRSSFLQRPSFLQRNSSTANARAKEDSRPLLYYAVMFNELREQSDAFQLHKSPQAQQHSHAFAPSASVATRHLSRPDGNPRDLLASLQQETEGAEFEAAAETVMIETSRMMSTATTSSAYHTATEGDDVPQEEIVDLNL